jgi:hypothetical protein
LGHRLTWLFANSLPTLAKLQHDPAALALLTQTFLVKKPVFEIKQIESNVESVTVTKDPSNGKSSTYRIDVAFDPEKTEPGAIAGYLEIFTDDSKFPHPGKYHRVNSALT